MKNRHQLWRGSLSAGNHSHSGGDRPQSTGTEPEVSWAKEPKEVIDIDFVAPELRSKIWDQFGFSA